LSERRDHNHFIDDVLLVVAFVLALALSGWAGGVLLSLWLVK
jgi:hypothetical protein